jgi:aryl-alcohol dehydrogenase-like predicted oxidoreductase
MTDTSIVNTRSLGRTDIQISPIGLGLMEFSRGKGLFGLAFPELSRNEKNAIIKAALDGGINWFDTAEMYGLGESERSLSQGLNDLGIADSQVVIATKWLPLLRTAGTIYHNIEYRQRALAGYTIDLFMVHQPWGLSPPEAEMDAMANLVKAGRIRSVGVSNFDAERMVRAYEALQRHNLPLAVNQMHYSLLQREIESNGVLDTARALGVTIIAYTPLGSGLLTGKYHKDPELLEQKPFPQRMMLRRDLERTRPLIEAMDEIAAAHNATIAQVALNWVVNFHGETIVTIPGATKVEQARDNAGALNFKLTENEMARLDELSSQLM